MTIIILYPNSFPYSGAATNRIISIARGLVETGNKVELIITRPTERSSNTMNRITDGVFQGIKYRYASNKLIWPSSRIGKLKSWLLGFLHTIICLFRIKTEIVISAATTGFFENFIYSLICRQKKIKFLHTLDEYPWVLINYDIYSNLYRNFYLKFYYKLFDAFIIMTKTLMDYYRPLARKNAKFVHIPMTVDFDRFNVPKNPSDDQYIAYCGGDTSGTKDGIDILIKAFNQIKDEYPDLKLYIIGKVHPKIENLVESLKIIDRVLFWGFVNRDKVPDLLVNAKALCLARPANKQAEGGFPTKLGEYLASARPVIVTDVGEISVYLKDSVSAYIAKPGDIESFASKIKEVLDKTEDSERVGRSGKVVAKDNFDYLRQGEALNKFLHELI